MSQKPGSSAHDPLLLADGKGLIASSVKLAGHVVPRHVGLAEHPLHVVAGRGILGRVRLGLAAEPRGIDGHLAETRAAVGDDLQKVTLN